MPQAARRLARFLVEYSAPADVALPEAEVQPFSEQSSFSWTRNWYPVALVNSLDTQKPNAVTLLNRGELEKQ